MKLNVLVMGLALVAGGVASTAGSCVIETTTICREPGRYVGWPTICRRADGELLVVFSGDRDGHVCPWGRVQMIRSRDDGKTWSAPVTVQNGILDDRDAGLVELRDGTLLLNWFTSTAFYNYAKSHAKDPAKRDCPAQYLRHFEKLPQDLVKETLGCWSARSTDGGKTWSEPARMTGSLPHGVTELKDGRIIAVTRRYDSAPGILCEESADGGRRWRVLSTLPLAAGVRVASLHEPHAVELPDGRLVAQARWHENPMAGAKCPDCPGQGIVQAESTDGGKTWTPLAPTKLIGYPPHLLVLRDGRLLTVYGKRVPERCGQYACLSSDGGKTWDVENEILLCPFVNIDQGYPSSVQLTNGEILTVYYQPPGPGQMTTLMMTRWLPPPASMRAACQTGALVTVSPRPEEELLK